MMCENAVRGEQQSLKSESRTERSRKELPLYLRARRRTSSNRAEQCSDGSERVASRIVLGRPCLESTRLEDGVAREREIVDLASGSSSDGRKVGRLVCEPCLIRRRNGGDLLGIATVSFQKYPGV